MQDPLEALDDQLNDHPVDDKHFKKFIKAPFRYHGSKSRSLQHILPHLPMRDVWVDVFGGSGVVTLNREPSRKLDVWNDRWSGVYSFFKTVRNKHTCEELIQRLSLMPNCKEQFYECRKRWDVNDDVERAARWYYLMSYSFGGVGRNWGRVTHSKMLNYTKRLEKFPIIQRRMMYCQIENEDYRKVLLDYDSSKTVFYCDPPYLDSYKGGYNFEMSEQDHIDLLSLVQDLEGFVAISSYHNELYDSFVWDDVIEWEIVGAEPNIGTSTNHRHSDGESKIREEVLYIKFEK